MGSKAGPLILNLLKHSDSKVRSETVKLLNRGNYLQIQQEIELLFFEQDEMVRETGFRLLKEIAPDMKQNRIKLFIRCMGNFNAYLDSDWSNPLIWRTLKAKELFAYFLHWKGQPVSSERILADLWPDLEVDKARDLFHTNLSYVRNLLKSCGLEGNLEKRQTGYVPENIGNSL